MSEIISFFVIISGAIIAFRLIAAKNNYEKITAFYLLFTHIIILFLVNSAANFDAVLDIVITLFLLKLVAVSFLILNRRKT
jgi:hypothetical protein